MRPLVEAGLLPADWPVTVNAVSGYSGGGKAMIAEFEDAAAGLQRDTFRIYAMSLAHKHVPEMPGARRPDARGRCSRRPSAAIAQGMIVEVPLQLWALPDAPTPGGPCTARWPSAYAGERFVEVASLEEAAGAQDGSTRRA